MNAVSILLLEETRRPAVTKRGGENLEPGKLEKGRVY
jgi:hypothetical protein